jgi:phosphatidylserine decarboxylase
MPGPNEIELRRPPWRKGQELGWFEHGSTILLLLPQQAAVKPAVVTGQRLRMGEALFTPAAL